MLDPTKLPLRDIHVPAPISWWPLAPGWWVLAAILLGSIIIMLGTWWWRRRTRLRRAGQSALLAIEQRYQLHKNPQQLASEISALCRQLALALAPQSTIASVTGRSWLEKLDHYSAEHFFTQGAGQVLSDAPYNPRITFDGNGLLNGMRNWLKRLPPPGKVLHV